MLPVLKIVTDLFVGLLLQFAWTCFHHGGKRLNILPLSLNQHTFLNLHWRWSLNLHHLPPDFRHKCIVCAICQGQSTQLLVPSGLSLWLRGKFVLSVYSGATENFNDIVWQTLTTLHWHSVVWCSSCLFCFNKWIVYPLEPIVSKTNYIVFFFLLHFYKVSACFSKGKLRIVFQSLSFKRKKEDGDVIGIQAHRTCWRRSINRCAVLKVIIQNGDTC